MKCEKCQGLGCYEPPGCRGFVKCSECKGKGRIGEDTQPQDQAQLGESLEIVQIPAGTEDA